MRVPGVTALVGGVAGGAVQMLQAGVQGVTTAADAVQTLTGPVLDSVSQSTARLLGTGRPTNGNRDGASATVRWQSGQRVHLDLDPLLPFPRWHEHAAVVEDPVRKIAGVASAHVEGALGRLVVEIDDGVDADDVLETVRDVVNSAAADLAAAGREPQIRTAPFADPGNPLAVLVPLTAAAFDAVAISAAVTGWVIRLPAAPRTTRAAAALLNNQPRMIAVLESRLGRVGTDLVLSASTAAANGLTQAVGTPLLNLVERVLQISEAEAHRRRWRDREPELASPNRPQAPVVPVISSTGAKSQAPRHNWAAAAAGEASHVVVDGSIDAAIDTAKGLKGGPVEDYVDQAANGSLIAAASALVAGGGPEDAAGAVLAGIPKAAHMGRQSFAAVLGRGLADDGQMILDPGALRRLDRVKVVVIDGAALRGDHRAVLHARGDVPGWDADRVYEVADALLHAEEPPEPDPDELPANTARLRWLRAEGPSATPAQGLEHADLVVDGETVGHVEVGWEVDPFAVPLLQIANRTGARVVLRHVAGTQDLAASVAASHPSGTPLLKLLRDLRADRGPVLLITALHRDFASTDTLAALAIADVGVALDDPKAATPWSADIITGTDLAAAVRILSALPAARARNLLRWFLRSEGLRPPSEARLAEMLRQLEHAALDARTRIAHDGAEIGCHRGRVVVHAPSAPPFLRAWEGEAELRLPGGVLRFERARGSGLAAVKLTQAPVTLRSRCGGERIRLAANRPSRAVKKLLQEAHLPPWQRDALPLVWSGDELVAVPGIGVALAYQAAPGEAGWCLSWRPARPT